MSWNDDRKMKKTFEEFNENLLTGVNRQIKLAQRLSGSAAQRLSGSAAQRLSGSAAQRLLLRKNTGAYCALACPSGYFEMEYINDGDCPWS